MIFLFSLAKAKSLMARSTSQTIITPYERQELLLSKKPFKIVSIAKVGIAIQASEN
jgi:hypothetical protein